MDRQLNELQRCVSNADSLSTQIMTCRFFLHADVPVELLQRLQQRLTEAQDICDRLLEAKTQRNKVRESVV